MEPRLSIGPIPTFYERLKDGKKCFCTDSIRDFLDFSDFMDFIDLIFEKNIQVYSTYRQVEKFN